MSPPHFVAAAIIYRGCGAVSFVTGNSSIQVCERHIVDDILHGVLYREFCAGEIFQQVHSNTDESSRQNASSNFQGWRTRSDRQFVISFDLFKTKQETNNIDKSKS